MYIGLYCIWFGLPELRDIRSWERLLELGVRDILYSSCQAILICKARHVSIIRIAYIFNDIRMIRSCIGKEQLDNLCKIPDKIVNKSSHIYFVFNNFGSRMVFRISMLLL